MRIAHLLAEPSRHGGAEAHALALAAAQAARGDDVILVALRPGPDAPAGVPLHVSTDPASALAAAAPDVVHVHGTPLGGGEEEALGRAVVRSLHDWSFACASGEKRFRGDVPCGRAHGAGCVEGILARGCAHRPNVLVPLRRLREISAQLPALRASGAVVVYSHAVREAALANGFPPERVHVVPYFVERAPAPAPVAAGRSFVFAGRVVGSKGLDVALRALAAAPGAWDELHVAGDGWARPDAERLAAELGIGARVRFHGWLDAAGVRTLVRDSRALLLPSRWPEPFGIAGLEALALGRPVVASHGGGIPEWLTADCGILVPPGDPASLAAAVALLDAEPGLAERLGRGGWERAARYSPAAHLERLDAVYASVAAARGRAA
ncbi:MAG TPA: glycosyltransferase family 4 protein [Gaiellaceae bacterium]|nr:glycosyltransferase family 4 protein [Gaiellaceae bacterium]